MGWGLLPSLLAGRHTSAKTDRSNFLGGLSGLNNIFNFALPVGKKEFAAGSELTGKAGDYYGKLLSGNRTAMLGAVAPETNVIRAGSDAQKRQLSTSGTARGGGTAAANQKRQSDIDARIDAALFGGRAGAAEGAARVGGTELSAAIGALGLGERAAGGIAEESRLSRENQQKVDEQSGSDAANMAMAIMQLGMSV